MLSFLSRFLKRKTTPADANRVSELPPPLARERIAHPLVSREGFPQVDWGMAAAWIAHQVAQGEWPGGEAAMYRAIAAGWLDEMCDALPTVSLRWRSNSVEGLAPRGALIDRVAKAAERSLAVIGPALRDLRGDPARHPIPPIAVIAFETADEYYSFISHFYEEEGEFATSGGIYVRSSAQGFPTFAVNAQSKYEIERTIAHELTHHALLPEHPELSEGLPMWVEEGLTQMMEEHVTRVPMFVFDHDTIRRHQSLWEEISFDEFASGASFHSPEGESQELSYNLAEALVRSLATTRRKDFFAFAKACRNDGQPHELAAREHLGATVQELAEAMVWRQTG